MKMLLILLSFLSLSTYANENYSTDRIIVKVKEDIRYLDHQLIQSHKNLFGKVFVIYTQDVEGLVKDLKSDPNVEYVEKDYKGTKNKLAEKDFLPWDLEGLDKSPFNDPYVGRQWTLFDANKSGISINGYYSSRNTKAPTEIIVAVVDTGVDIEHEDLPIWINENEIPNNGLDDDDNGYVDDIYGINTLIRDKMGNATMDISDTHGHGTHVAGSIGAIQNNSTGIVGNASNVKIMGIRTVPGRGDEKDVDVIEAFMYAAKNGAKIINCSFGKRVNEGGQAVSEAMELIGKEYGVLVVAAAGNSSQDIDRYKAYPASFENENLLVVASTTRRGGMSGFSNYGLKSVDVAAPGSGIYSSLPGNKYTSMSGTSMASPNTAGVAAEVLARFPMLTPVELKVVLMKSAVPVKSFSSRIASGGRVDLIRAIEMASQSQR
jgi:subtilisin family serine protease